MNEARADPRHIVWDVFAQAWADTEFESTEFQHFAARLRATGFDEATLQRILNREVCAGFALYTLAALLSAGMVLPAFYFPEAEARRRIQSWLARPRWRSLINPIWWVGLWAARSIAREHWQAIRLQLGSDHAA